MGIDISRSYRAALVWTCMKIEQGIANNFLRKKLYCNKYHDA